MKIIIDDPSMKRPIRLILPYHLAINLFVRKAFIKMIMRSQLKKLKRFEKEGEQRHSEEAAEKLEWAMRCIEAMNFVELRSALHAIAVYKGFELVDIEAADGTFVKITA